jgi:hypothetical protein
VRLPSPDETHPPGSRTDAALPVALVLHGRGNNRATVFGSHALQFFLADAQRMILDEFLPLLTARGLRTTRVARSRGLLAQRRVRAASTTGRRPGPFTFWRHRAPAQLHFLGAALAGT